MAKLNDAQYIILTNAYMNGDIVSAEIAKKLPNKSALTRNIRSLMKLGMVTTSAGLKGKATDKDYSFDLDAEDTGLRLFITTAGQNALEGNDAPAEVVEAIAPKEEVKAPKAKKAPKVKAPAPVVDEDEQDEEADEEERPCSVVKAGYKRHYRELKDRGGSGQGCNDAVDRFMVASFRNAKNAKGRKVLNVPALFEFATENGIDVTPWLLVNNGMKRMNVSLAIRHLIKKGVDVKWNGETIFKGHVQKKAA